MDKKETRGRKPFVATPELRGSVELMTASGIEQALISKALKIDEKTLRKHFREELDVGAVKVIARVSDSLVRQAMAGNVTAGIFFLKARAGWRDRPVDDAASKEASGKKAVAQADAERVVGDASGEWSGLLSAPQTVQPGRGKPN